MTTATATKKPTTKKAAAKPATEKVAKDPSETAKAKAEAEAKRQARADRDAELTVKVQALRADEVSWAKIAEELEISQGKAMFLDMCANVKPKDRITGDTDEELGAAIVEARETQELSWGLIAARTGLGEAKCRALFKEASGKEWLGHRIGKGGRYPGDENPNPDAPKSGGSKPSSSKVSAEARNPNKLPIAEMKLADLKLRFNDGVEFSYKNSEGKTVKQKVKSVTKFAGGTMTFTGTDGKSHAVKTESITKVGR